MKPENKILLMVALFVALFLVGIEMIARHMDAQTDRECRADPFSAQTTDIVRLFMNGTHDVTVLTQKGDGPEIVRRHIICDTVTMRADAPSDVRIWIDHVPREKEPCRCAEAVIHVHNAGEIEQTVGRK